MNNHLDLQAIQAQREIEARRILRGAHVLGGPRPGRESRWRHAVAHVRAAWSALTSHPAIAGEGGAPTP